MNFAFISMILISNHFLEDGYLMNEEIDKKGKPNVIMAVLPLVITIVLLIYLVVIKGGAPHIAIICAIAVTALMSRFRGYHWKEMLDSMVKAASTTLPTMGIVMLIGMLVGSWVITGTVPLLIVYGFKVISPGFFLPTVLLVSALISLATGTSWGTLGTIGLAFMGIGAGIGVPAYLTAGAIVSGAFFGDKVSPLSDTTNFCSGLVGVNLYKHIVQMMPSTIPAMVISFILYWVLGMEYAGAEISTAGTEEIVTALTTTFKLSPVLLLPPVVVIVLAVKKVPPLPTMFSGILIATILAVITQGAGLEAILGTVMYGYWSNTGVEIVDTLLSKGGLNSMLWIAALMILAVAFSGLLQLTRSIEVLIETVVSFVRGIGSAVVSASVSMLLLIYTSDLYIAYTVTARVFSPVFRGKGYSGTNVSRILENSGTMMTALVPWGAAGVYVTAMLGVPTLKYAPVAFACWLPLIFDALWGFSGKFLPKATDEEKEEWVQEDRLIARDGQLIPASQLKVSQL
ncbi:MAG: Na+/H+ antiporter NhaC [Spirochaetes bacterium]|nr:MAG: Na+/H+ antiporter NhaC [Spirochaetota bacterium]